MILPNHMFTGIIQHVVAVRFIKKDSGGICLEIARPKVWKNLQKGESITVDGVCLTLSGIAKNALRFDVMAQTRGLTTVASLQKGSIVNLERSLRATDAVGGHFVAGHVDAVGTVRTVTHEPNNDRLTVTLPREFLKYCPARGSVAIKGVSLTIAESSKTSITVALVPYTLKHTNLGLLKAADSVNIEIDLIARYIHAQVSGIRYNV